MMRSPTISWRRLEPAGREASTVSETVAGWRINGVAEFREANAPTCLAYVIRCGPHWETLSCDITGFIGEEAVAVLVDRDATGTWTVNGAQSPVVSGCVDIDLAFSPITNLLPIRRLNLRTGEMARVRAAWLTYPELTLQALDQTYTRLASDRYLYESGDGAFRRELKVNDKGLVVD